MDNIWRKPGESSGDDSFVDINHKPLLKIFLSISSWWLFSHSNLFMIQCECNGNCGEDSWKYNYEDRKDSV